LSDSFTYDANPGRVVFGVGTSDSLEEEITKLQLNRVFLIASPRHKAIADQLALRLGGFLVGRFTEVTQHVPALLADRAAEAARDCGADGVVTIGGGSATGLGKAIALVQPLVHIALPTTYAGSEMTPIWGLTRDGRKETGSAARVQPALVIYDPLLTLDLPPSIVGPSAFNALAHAVEATYATGTNPLARVLALEAIRKMHKALPQVILGNKNLESHTELLLGAYLAACSLAVAGTDLHHKACHVLGGMFNLGHGEMNSVLLPHALHYNHRAMQNSLREIELALDTKNAAGALYDLAHEIGAPSSLKSIGMPEDGIEAAATEIASRSGGNIRTPDTQSIADMLRNAYLGRRPSSISSSNL
jgi:maleylacetate reductase